MLKVIQIEHTESYQSQEFRSLTIGQINPLDSSHWYIIAGQASYNDINTYIYDTNYIDNTLNIQYLWWFTWYF